MGVKKTWDHVEYQQKFNNLLTSHYSQKQPILTFLNVIVTFHWCDVKLQETCLVQN